MYISGHHELEIIENGLEAEESETRFNACRKNPGHKKFIPVKDFLNNPLLQSVRLEDREELRWIMGSHCENTSSLDKVRKDQMMMS